MVIRHNIDVRRVNTTETPAEGSSRMGRDNEEEQKERSGLNREQQWFNCTCIYSAHCHRIIKRPMIDGRQRRLHKPKFETQIRGKYDINPQFPTGRALAFCNMYWYELIMPTPAPAHACLYCKITSLPLVMYEFKYDSVQSRRQLGSVGPGLEDVLPESVEVLPKSTYPSPVKVCAYRDSMETS